MKMIAGRKEGRNKMSEWARKSEKIRVHGGCVRVGACESVCLRGCVCGREGLCVWKGEARACVCGREGLCVCVWGEGLCVCVWGPVCVEGMCVWTKRVREGLEGRTQSRFMSRGEKSSPRVFARIIWLTRARGFLPRLVVSCDCSNLDLSFAECQATFCRLFCPHFGVDLKLARNPTMPRFLRCYIRSNAKNTSVSIPVL